MISKIINIIGSSNSWISAKSFNDKSTQSHHRRIASGFLMVSFFVVLAKLAGAAREMTMAWRYGASSEVDSYLFVFSFYSWPVSVWFSLLMAVAVPVISRAKIENPSELPNYIKEYFGIALACSVVLGAASIILLFVALNFGRAYLSDGLNIEATFGLALALSPIVPLGVLAGSLSGWVIASGSHRNTLFDGIPALVIFLFLLMPTELCSTPLIYGTIAGFGAQVTALSLHLAKQKVLVYPVFSKNSVLWGGFTRDISIILIGQVLMGATGLIDQVLATELRVGSVATLNYANRIIALFFSMAVLTVTRAILPVMSDSVTKGESVLDQITTTWVCIVGFVGLLVAGGAVYFSPWLVSTFFQRGAFSSDDTIQVSEALVYGIGQIPFYLSGMVIYSSNSAKRKYLNNSLAMVASVFAKLLVVYPLFQFYGIRGIQLSNVALYAAFWAVLLGLFLLQKNFGGNSWKNA
jgi:putative peptidoglycan lipid II flippase